MTVREHLERGQLHSAIAATEAAIRNNPLDYRQRTTLFTLLCYIGELNRAEQQLSVLSQESADAERGTGVYRGLLKASQTREQVMRGEAPPQCLLAEPSYLAAQSQAVLHIARSELDAALDALKTVAELRPPCSMRVGDQVGQLWDADVRVGPFVELFVHDQYYWLPFEQLRGLRIPPPVHLRDLLWAPVVVELDAGPLQAFMPILYPESHRSADQLVQLGRKTAWADNEQGLSIGQGARLLALYLETSADEPLDFPLFEIGRIDRVDARAMAGVELSASSQLVQESAQGSRS